MQKGNSYTVGQWCDRWFCENQGRWSGSTVGGYHNLIYRHILPGIGDIPLAELTEASVRNGSMPVAMPDFTRGAWRKVEGFSHAMAE